MEITITGCIDCPFCYEYDMAVGFGCKADKQGRTISEDAKTGVPSTPEWCPIKTQPVIVTY